MSGERKVVPASRQTATEREEAERIDGGDPTFRVEFTIAGSRTLVDGAELLGHSEAVRLARDVFAATTVPILVHVVNERTGFTCDEIVRRPD